MCEQRYSNQIDLYSIPESVYNVMALKGRLSVGKYGRIIDHENWRPFPALINTIYMYIQKVRNSFTDHSATTLLHYFTLKFFMKVTNLTKNTPVFLDEIAK